ncbi:MAG: FecR family protein [Acidobacteriota bacterium]|nr:FecR family protein [Acidobacteriota bacterium]
MKAHNLDAIINDIRTQPIAEDVVGNAAARVRSRLFGESSDSLTAAAPSADRLRNCSDFQALIADYLTRSLSPSRSLLLVDHTHSCVDCRRALELARSGNLRVLPRPTTASSTVAPVTRWAVAALLTIGTGLGTWAMVRSMWVPAGTRAAVQAVNGTLFYIADRSSTPIFSGRQLGDRQSVRTSKGSTAMLRLTDGSLVEMNERSEVSVSRAARGTTIHLGRGNIVVQAAKQRDGALYVATADCQVAVKGTVFAVTSAIKGSRVSVVEGKVKVDQGSQSQLLTPGQQTTTSPNMEKMAVQDDIAWSRDAARYLSVLGDLSAIQKGLEHMPAPGVRTSSKLLDRAPWNKNVIVYAAIPNIGATLEEATRLFEERIQQSPALKQWWDDQQSAHNRQPALRDMVQKIRTASNYLGDEIVLAISGDPDGTNTSPVLLAEVKRPGLREYLESSLNQSGAGRNAVRFLDNAVSARTAASARSAAASNDSRQTLAFVNNSILAISPDAAQLQTVAEQFQENSAADFTGDVFHNRIQQAYQSGATWLFCANMEQITRKFVRGERVRQDAVRDITGFSDVRYLILERKDVNGQTKNQATLSFRNARHGLASWLAAPGPMGSLDFVSADSSVAASFVIKNPGALLGELLAEAEAKDPELAKHIDDFQRTSGVNIIQDLAAPLGSDLTFAIDGPLVPVPSWKVAVEVYSPDLLQWGIEHIVNAVNQQPDAPGKLSLTKEQVGSRVFYTLKGSTAKMGELPFEIDYVFVDSYLLAAANRSLLNTAIQNRATGYTLSHSAKFRDQLPRDAYANFSGIVYHDLGGAINSVVDRLKSVHSLSAEEKQSIAALQASSAPGLIYAYGEPDRIVLSSSGSLFGFNMNTLALPAVIQQALPHVKQTH